MSGLRAEAPPGQIWVCRTCGRSAKRRCDVGQLACQLVAVLVHEWTVVRDPESGLVRKAKAVTP